jgi:hypothetical protein
MSTRAAQTCYTTVTGKNRKFPREHAPKILQSARSQAKNERELLLAWMGEHRVNAVNNRLDELIRLHRAARLGTYKETRPMNCDRTQSAKTTITRGGDCDQWAAVLLACLLLLGHQEFYLVAFGTPGADEFEHVAVMAMIGERAYLLDPKGSQAGAEFDDWPEGMEPTEEWLLP